SGCAGTCAACASAQWTSPARRIRPGQCEHKALKAAVAGSKKAAEQEKIAQLMLETPVRVPPSLTARRWVDCRGITGDGRWIPLVKRQRSREDRRLCRSVKECCVRIQYHAVSLGLTTLRRKSLSPE